MDLISKESVLDKAGRVVVDQDHYNAANHFPDLMVYEALPDDIESKKIIIKVINLNINDVAL